MKSAQYRNRFHTLRSLVYSGFCLLPALASAHPGHFHPGEEDEFDAITSGFVHPFTGMDHLLLALAVGWLAFGLGKGKSLLSGVSFLVALTAGAFAGRGIQTGAGLEIALSLTLIVLGAVFLIGKVPKTAAITAAISTAGFIHGFAHGSEAMPGIPFICYAAGFLAGAAALLGIGGVLNFAASKSPLPISRMAGGAMVALGSIFFLQAL